MTRRVQLLDGPDWLVREALGETWRWYVEGADESWANNTADAARAAETKPGWLPAEVPGSVITDLRRRGEVPDPYRARASREVEWTGYRSWVYRRRVELPALAGNERAVLEFDGIDPSGAIYWDGQLLGRIEGLYRRGRLELPNPSAGEHVLAVALDPVPPSQPQVGRTELVRVHRPRLNEGWDFCPRFPHQGIWRPVRLVLAEVHVSDVSVGAELTDDQVGVVHLTATVDRAAAYELRVTDEGTGRVWQRSGATPRGRLGVDLELAEPRLWQPNGYGDPVTYPVELLIEHDVVWHGRTGFRRVEFVPNSDAPADARSYTAHVNGVPIPLVGWNWAPADAQYGAVRPERVRQLVGLAARSSARLLRVWGGGLLETDEFYDACDRAGVLVWQEFSQSSSGRQNAPATDPEFVRLMTEEAAAGIPPRTHHPSLVIWGGGNELEADGTPLGEDRSPVLAALRERVERLDPGRHWLPTSPSGPRFANRLDEIAAAPEAQHDVHGPWEHQGLRAQHTLYNAGVSLAHTEFGVEGMTNLRSLERLVPADQRWPADRSNAVYRHLGEWWNNAPLVQQCFGNRLGDVPALLRASQLLQATGLAYAVEADRRRWPRCSMVLPWQLAESYPNAWCTACVDHQGNPKPAFYAVARAFTPRRITARVPTSVWADEPELTAEIWLWAEFGEPAGGAVIARLRSADGAVLAQDEWRVDEPVTHPRAVGTLRVPAEDVPRDAAVGWELEWRDAADELIDSDVVLACTGADFAPLLDLAPATLDVSCSDGVVEVRHRAGPMVVGLQLVDARDADATGWLAFDGDPRPLLPGQTRRFRVQSRGTTGSVDARLESWNTDPVLVRFDAENPQ